MNNIELHKVDAPEVIKLNYELALNKYPIYITNAKQTFKFLFYVFRESKKLLQMSVLEKSEFSLQKEWFNYGLNCISEFCRLAHFLDEEKEAQIDDLGSFRIKVESLQEFKGGIQPIHWARIARNKEKEKMIAEFTEDFSDFNRNLTFNHTYINILTKLEIEYSLTGNFNKNYYNQLVEIYENNSHNIGAKVSLHTNHTLYYIHPYVIALKSLVGDNKTEFNENLIKALEAHKQVWGQKKALNRGGTPLCRENEGFLSWGCTALAVMAQDRGWKLEVESDYMPKFIVDGGISEE